MSCVIKVKEPEPRRCFNESGPVMTDTFYLSYSNGNHGTLIWRMSRLSAQLFSDERAAAMVTWLSEQFQCQGVFEAVKASARAREETDDLADLMRPPKDLVLSAGPVQAVSETRTASPVAERDVDVDDFLSGL